MSWNSRENAKIRMEFVMIARDPIVARAGRCNGISYYFCFAVPEMPFRVT